MAYVRELKRKGGHVYYERVESYRDENGKVRTRVLEYLGTSKTPPPDPIPIKGIDFASIAARLMDEKLTPNDVFEVLEHIGKKPATLDELDAVGIRFDLAQKKLYLYLLPKGFTWKAVPPRAPRAKKDSGAKGRGKGAASQPSKAKRG